MTRRSTDTSVDGCARIRPNLQCFVNEIAKFDTLSRSVQQGTRACRRRSMIVGGARAIFQKGYGRRASLGRQLGYPRQLQIFIFS